MDVGRESNEYWRRREYADNMRAQTEALKQQAEAAKRQASAAERQSFNQNSSSQSYTPRYNSGGNIIDKAAYKIVPPLLIGVAIIYFIKTYWMYVVSVAIAVACIFICRLIYRKAIKPGIKILLTILASIALIVIVLVAVPSVNSNAKKPLQSRNQTAPVQERYMLVDANALNVRKGPSASYDVVGQLTKGTRVQILDSSGQWWKIRSGNIEGYVHSEYLISEGNTSSVSPSTMLKTVSTSSNSSSEPGSGRSGFTSDPEFQRSYEEASARNPPEVVPLGLVLPSGETVKEFLDSGKPVIDK